jgi:hypothetical protein
VNKVPVWRTIGSAYAFAFHNLATIIGLTWLPLTILLVGGYFAISHYFDGVLLAIGHGNRYEAYAGAGYFYLYRAVSLLLEAIVAVSVMRLALGQRGGGGFVHFALGLTELRMFAANVAYVLILDTIEIAAGIIVILAAVGIGVLLRAIGPIDGVPPQTTALLAVAIILFAYAGVLLFVTTRLSFLLVPVTVAEDRIDLIRAWELSRGNFWRLFLISFCVGVPVWLIYLGIQFAFVGFAATGEATSVSPFNVSFAGSLQAVAARMYGLLAWLPYIYGAWFLVRPLVLGLTSGAAAAAYRTLVPGTEAVSTPAAGLPAAIG